MGLQTAMSSTAPIHLPGAHLQSLVSSSGELCGRLPGLVLQQLDVCRRNPLAMPCVGLGARLGLVECQFQFQYERWNCSPSTAAAAAAAAAADATVSDGDNVTSSVDTLIQRGTLSLWPPYVIGRPLHFCPVVSFFYLLRFPRLILAAAGWMSTIL